MTLWGTPSFQVLPKNISYYNPIFVAGYGINSMNFYMAAYILVYDSPCYTKGTHVFSRDGQLFTISRQLTYRYTNFTKSGYPNFGEKGVSSH